MKMKLCLLYGGKSAEHEVSLQTAKAVIHALDKNKFDIFPIFITKQGQWIQGPQITEPVEDVKQLQFSNGGNELMPQSLNAEFDMVFPLLHGPNGEDGTVQGLLEVLNIPYVGNGVLASSAGMDKVVMKNIFAQAGLDQVEYVSIIRSTWEEDREAAYKEVEETIGYPSFVKPANLGSSVGISKCDNREELVAAFEEAFRYDRKIIIEEGVIAREIEVGILGNDELACSVAGEIVPKKEFYDYEAKYADNTTELVIPADIPETDYDTVRDMAFTAYKALDCSGLARMDFFVTPDGRVLINEVNTMPGFTPVSMFPLLWKNTGVPYPELIERLVDLGRQRYEEKQTIVHTF
ncbi:D-alanine--D-alanine ligase [Siminovitchia acidinfaciens]|uniref:D-alanine--D-alanine ligase n=1 Tax=Siminovitchia acidinfaciens TaxID=2321395 RepID=A0A429XZ40_9BACI|nr:D-alanine--D-alanine ligase [Siminovitchia acidinfaciens]RST74054.1 D-alanine--D-alanine ligase [Siminovitchia acidinfaciens]